MDEVVLDANVLVGLLDGKDVLATRAVEVLARLRASGLRPVLLDVCVGEAVSVLCRRAQQRKTNPPDLRAALASLRGAAARGEIRFVAQEAARRFPQIFQIVEETGGVVNFNDALLVALQRSGDIDGVVSFDQGLDAATDFRRIS